MGSDGSQIDQLTLENDREKEIERSLRLTIMRDGG